MSNADPRQSRPATPVAERMLRFRLPGRVASGLPRPNDPLLAAECRELVGQIVAECIEAGAAEIVSEFALPLSAHALSAALNLPPDHAEEWISWGPAALECTTGMDPATRDAVDNYVCRQVPGTRRTDFFSALASAGRHGAALTLAEQRSAARTLLTVHRGRVVAILTAALDWLAGSPTEVRELQSDSGFRDRAVVQFLVMLPAAAASEPCRAAAGAAHAGLVLRSVFKVVGARIERLTLIEREPRLDRGDPLSQPLEYRSLLLAFKPLD